MTRGLCLASVLCGGVLRCLTSSPWRSDVFRAYSFMDDPPYLHQRFPSHTPVLSKACLHGGRWSPGKPPSVLCHHHPVSFSVPLRGGEECAGRVAAPGITSSCSGWLPEPVTKKSPFSSALSGPAGGRQLFISLISPNLSFLI